MGVRSDTDILDSPGTVNLLTILRTAGAEGCLTSTYCGAIILGRKGWQPARSWMFACVSPAYVLQRCSSLHLARWPTVTVTGPRELVHVDQPIGVRPGSPTTSHRFPAGVSAAPGEVWFQRMAQDIFALRRLNWVSLEPVASDGRR